MTVTVASSVEDTNEKRIYWREQFSTIMQSKSFIPAGNTLIAGIKNYPNCSILSPPTDTILNKLIEDLR